MLPAGNFSFFPINWPTVFRESGLSNHEASWFAMDGCCH